MRLSLHRRAITRCLPCTAAHTGVDVPNENSMPLEQALQDDFRMQYLHDYISAMSSAVQSGVPVRGYFCWSLLDK
jgi:beta-glucosidase